MTKRRVVAVVASLLLFGVVAVVVLLFAPGFDRDGFLKPESSEAANSTLTAIHRKLLVRATAMEEPNRIRGDKCSKADIVINQGPTPPLPSGIPTYTVEIMNMCVTGCDISHIHLTCGWFSSARLVNPKIFKRLRYNDCLVNDGKPLANGGTVSFQYANTFSYKLSVSSVTCS
ncbi:TPD1 protein homolog 1-like [Pyrus communis]|uniref:TPD1 protein homolog 1-like n=1 Tax=Pyrus communis TaxID=23211 RepID=UPI0035C05AC3